MAARIARLVLGPPSTGTRLATRLLIHLGYIGDGGHSQRWDDGIPEDAPDRIVWRRSVPHGTDYKVPHIEAMIGHLRGLRYDVRPVVTVRDWYSMLESQRRNHTNGSLKDALKMSQLSYRAIFYALGGTRYTVVTYESLILTEGTSLQYAIGEYGRQDTVIKNENVKYYDHRV